MPEVFNPQNSTAPETTISPNTTEAQVTVYSPDGREASVPQSSLQQALGAGFTTLSPKAGDVNATAIVSPGEVEPSLNEADATLNVVSPDGKPASIPKSSWGAAKAAGFILKSQQGLKSDLEKASQESGLPLIDVNDPDALKKIAKQQHLAGVKKEYEGNVGEQLQMPILQFGEGFENTIFGSHALETLSEKLNQSTPQQVEDYEYLKKMWADEHPNISEGLHLAGTGAGLYGLGKLASGVSAGAKVGLTGLGFEAASRGLPAAADFLTNPWAQRGIAGVASGLAMSTPQAAAQIALEHNPKAAIESLIAGGGVAGALDVALPALGVGYKALRGTAQEGVEGATSKFGQVVAANDLKLSPQVQNTLRKQFPDWVKVFDNYKDAEGTKFWELPNAEARANAIQDMLKEGGPEIGSLYKSAEDLTSKLGTEAAITVRPNVESLAQKLENLKGLDQEAISSNKALQEQFQKEAVPKLQELQLKYQSLEEQAGQYENSKAQYKDSPAILEGINKIQAPVKQAMLGVKQEMEQLASKGKALTDEMEKLSTQGPAYHSQTKLIDDAIAQIRHDASKDGTIGFEKFRKLTSKVNEAFSNAPKDELQVMRNRIADAYRAERNEAIARLANTAGPEGIALRERLGTLNQLFGIAKATENSAIKVLGQGATDVNSWLPTVGHGGVGSIAAGGLAHLFGLPAAPVMAAHMAGGLGYKLLRKYMTNGGWVKTARALNALGDSPNVGSHLITHSANTLESQLSKIPEAIKAWAGKTVIANSATEDVKNAVKNILGEAANGRSANKQLDFLMNKLTTAQLASGQRLQEHSLLLSDHPEAAKAAAAQQDRLLEYLVRQMPKDPSAHLPFSHSQQWDASKISSVDKDNFNKILAVANNPMHIIEELKNNTLTTKQVAAAEFLNPEITRLIRQAVIDQGYSGKHDPSLAQKMQMSILLGQNVSNALNQVPALQQAYMPINPGSVNGPPPAQGKKHASGGGFRVAENSSTNVQNLMDLNLEQ